MSDREFILDRDVTAGGNATAGYVFDRETPGVVVHLASGAQHRYVKGTYTNRGDDGSLQAQYDVGSSYEVQPSGALAIIGWRVWSQGWPPGVNDLEEIVATYGPQQWSRVTGRCEPDPWRAAAQERRHEAQNR